jgi:hypothetical protein
MTDPLLSYYGHPILPAGYNSWENDGDDINGPGVNEPVWPYLFDSFIPLEVLIITPEMMEIFDGCADYVVPGMVRDIPVPSEPQVYLLGAPLDEVKITMPLTEFVIAAADNVIAFPAEQRTLVIPGESLKRSA